MAYSPIAALSPVPLLVGIFTVIAVKCNAYRPTKIARVDPANNLEFHA
jgi:hypothetical protein